MTKKTTQRYVYKIKSSRLRNSKWDLQLSIKSAKENDELISLADSTVLRFIREINSEKDVLEENKRIRKDISDIKKLPTSLENRRRIEELYNQLDELLFVRDYICVVMSNNKDFDMCNKGFKINGISFKRLLATTGGVKNNTVIYINEKIHSELNRRIDNGRDMSKPIVPAKLEAYKALACSSSIPIDFAPTFKREGDIVSRVLVVDDCVTNFKANVIQLDDTISVPPEIVHKKDYDIKLEDSDGYGMISPRLSKEWTEQLDRNNDYISSGFCIRNSFCKGMLFTFDFHDFAKSIAKKDIVIDAWNNEINVSDVDIILTTSMLKLYDSYNSVEHYLQCCENNGHEFSITKIIPKELENERNLNYQFIQPLKLDDKDIEQLIKPTIDEFKDVLGGDYKKSLLFLKGSKMNEKSVLLQESDYTKALMIDERMINDPFVRSRIHSMLTKKIKDAKVGVLKTNGNFSIISGDIYSLAQSIFGLEVTGLLMENEFYSEYWNERCVDKVAAFRAPMTCHNNIRILRLKNTKEMRKWYRYMNRCTIFNSWDTTTHALNGADKDSDTVLTTNNPVILKGIIEKDAIVCKQSSVDKVIPTEELLIKSNKNGFGDAIGTITNKITSMFAVQSQFEEGSKGYIELEHRIMWGQHFQQLAIDKIKGIKGVPMPKEWYSYHANIINDDDSEDTRELKEFNVKILADKKPYFMCYIYPNEMKKYKTYVNKANKNSLIRFGLSLDELTNKMDRTDDEEVFIKHYYLKMPVNTYPSLMNKICYMVESEMDGILKQYDSDFNHNILINGNVEYSKTNYDKIKKIYNKYKKETQRYFVEKEDDERLDGFTKSDMRKMFVQRFKAEAEKACSNKDELCNIVLDLCYTNNESKQFAWDLCGDTIINNLLINNDYKLKYPTLDEDGDVKFNGLRFAMKEIQVYKEELDEDNIRREG